MSLKTWLASLKKKCSFAIEDLYMYPTNYLYMKCYVKHSIFFLFKRLLRVFWTFMTYRLFKYKKVGFQSLIWKKYRKKNSIFYKSMDPIFCDACVSHLNDTTHFLFWKIDFLKSVWSHHLFLFYFKGKTK